MTQEKKLSSPLGKIMGKTKCEEMMLDLGPKESLEIQKTDDRGKALGGWGNKCNSMTTWSSKLHPGTYDGSRVGIQKKMKDEFGE